MVGAELEAGVDTFPVAGDPKLEAHLRASAVPPADLPVPPALREPIYAVADVTDLPAGFRVLGSLGEVGPHLDAFACKPTSGRELHPIRRVRHRRRPRRPPELR